MLLSKPYAWLEKLLTGSVTYDKIVFRNGTPVPEKFTQERTHWIFKPLWGCPPCMSSIWGTAIYWIFFAVSIQEWVVCCVASAFVSAYLWKRSGLE